ncbi:MAG: DUF1501 domain-containing protein [Verrucomicrobiota bacterium]
MSQSKDNQISRRRFLGEAPCAAVGSISLFSSLLSLKLTNAAAAANAPSISNDDDYKALVCVFLAGGNDSYNMLVPRQNDAYNVYANTRAHLALSQESLLPITTTGQAYSEFGLHEQFTRMQSLYDDGNLAFIANIGTLIRPTTKSDYNSRSFLPKGLFSHSDQQAHWQTCVPQVRGASPGGWGGRIAELMESVNADSNISMNISVSGLNTFQANQQTFTFVANNNGAADMVAYDDPFEKAAVDSLLTENYKNLFSKTFGRNSRRFIDSSIVFNEAFDNTQIATLFPATNFGNSLKTVARTIAAQSKLNMKRQCFFVRIGGWDHHSELLNAQGSMLPNVSDSIYSFWNALGELGMQDNVVTFSASDFGRTLTSNDVGSDHGWGGNAFVMGGPVQGGKIYGNYPELHIGSNSETGRGRQIPTTSVDQYGAELARWFGVSNGELSTIFPNLENFFDPYSVEQPIGFINQNV